MASCKFCKCHFLHTATWIPSGGSHFTRKAFEDIWVGFGIGNTKVIHKRTPFGKFYEGIMAWRCNSTCGVMSQQHLPFLPRLLYARVTGHKPTATTGEQSYIPTHEPEAKDVCVTIDKIGWNATATVTNKPNWVNLSLRWFSNKVGKWIGSNTTSPSNPWRTCHNTVKFFAWLLTQNRIHCRAALVHKHILDDARCELCGLSDETADHILSECSFAQSFWTHIGWPSGVAKVSELWNTQPPPRITKRSAEPPAPPPLGNLET